MKLKAGNIYMFSFDEYSDYSFQTYKVLRNCDTLELGKEWMQNVGTDKYRQGIRGMVEELERKQYLEKIPLPEEVHVGAYNTLSEIFGGTRK